MKERDAFEQMDRSAGLRRERRGERAGSPGRSAAGSTYGSPGRSAANAPAVGRSFAVSGAISNDDDDSTDGEPMPGITRRQPHKAPYRGGGHKLAQQSRRPSREVSMAGVTHDDTSEGESTPTQPPPPPNMPPPPSVVARGPPPPSLPNRDRRQSMSDDDNDYSTEAEMTRLNQRVFVPSRRRHSPSRNTGRRQDASASRYSNQHAGTGRRDRFSPDRSRGSRGREHNGTAQQDPAVIVMPSSRPRREANAEQLNYDSALSF